jgi:hypothetical protein
VIDDGQVQMTSDIPQEEIPTPIKTKKGKK